MGAQTLLLQGVAIVTQLLLARLILPEFFGVIAIAATVQTVAAVLVASGLGTAVVRMPELGRPQLVTATRLNVAFGLVVAAIVLLSTPVLASAFDQPLLAQVLPVYAAVVALTGLQVVPLAHLQRVMDFKSVFLIQLPATVVGAIVALAIAFVSPSIWALAAQPLVTAVVVTVLLLVQRRVTLRGPGDREAAGPLLRFGLPLAGSGILDAVWAGLPAVVIVATLGPAVGGVYFVADRLKTAVVLVFFQTISTVALPALAAASAADRLLAAIREATRVSTAVLIPALLVIATQTGNAFGLFLGPEWAQGAQFAAIMFIGALMYPSNALSISVMSVRGRSGLILVLEIVKRAAALVVLLLFLPLGVDAYLWAMAVLALVAYFPNSWYAVRHVGYRYRDQLRDVAGPAIAGVLAAAALVAIDRLTNLPAAVVLFALAPVTLIAAWALLVLVDPTLRRDAAGLRALSARRAPAPPLPGEDGVQP